MAEVAGDGERELPLSAATRALLEASSTATVQTQLFNRGLRNTFLYGLRPANPAAARFVGPAFTLRYIPAREDIDVVDVFVDPAHPQRAAVESVPLGHVLVMDCRRDPRAASGGHILATRLMVRGAAALVTDATVRDYPAISELAFPVYSCGPNATVNLAHHHAVDMQVPVGCAGVAVYPGDVLLGDAEGVVVIPRHLVDEVARDAAEQQRVETFLQRKVLAGAPLPGTYPPNAATLAEYRESVSGEQR
jgi:regulator of RNase E activity RraA